MSTTHFTPIPLGVYVGTVDSDTPALVAAYDASIANFTTLMGESPEFSDTGADDEYAPSTWLSNAQWDASSWAASPDASKMTPVIELPMASTAAGLMSSAITLPPGATRFAGSGG